MPLRDHFRPPLDEITSWEGFHGGWPMVIVQQLKKRLPPGYVAAPHVHSGSQIEIDVAAYERDAPSPGIDPNGNGGGVATVMAGVHWWLQSRRPLNLPRTRPGRRAVIHPVSAARAPRYHERSPRAGPPAHQPNGLRPADR